MFKKEDPKWWALRREWANMLVGPGYDEVYDAKTTSGPLLMPDFGSRLCREGGSLEGSGEPPDDTAPSAAERNRATAERVFQSSDWSLGNVLSWIAFREQALICRFDGFGDSGRYVKSLNRLRLYGSRSFGREQRPMLVDTPAQLVLAALQDGDLTAIRDGQEIVRFYWFGRDVRDLTDDLHFQSAQVKAIDRWGTERDEAPTSSAAAKTATTIATETANTAIVEKLAEWIFAQRTQLSHSGKLFAAARQNKQIGAFRKIDFLAAYQRVYSTQPHRPPASGWPLRSTYAQRAEAEKSSK